MASVPLHAGEALAPFVAARPAPEPDLQALDLEFSSRGDRATARLLRSAEPVTPCPLAVLVHDAGGCSGDAVVEPLAIALARQGAAAVALDLPLHGPRRSAKLTEKFLAVIEGREPGEEGTILFEQVLAQSVADVGAAIAAAGAASPLAEPAAIVGIGFGARVAALAAPVAGVDAAVLVCGPELAGLAGQDPLAWPRETAVGALHILADAGHAEADRLAKAAGGLATRAPRPDEDALPDSITRLLLGPSGPLRQ